MSKILLGLDRLDFVKFAVPKRFLCVCLKHGFVLKELFLLNLIGFGVFVVHLVMHKNNDLPPSRLPNDCANRYMHNPEL